MTAPIQLSALPEASSADNNDYTLLRKGLTDYKVAVGILRNIDVSSLPSLPGGATAQPTDHLLISRSGSNYKINFSQIGFLSGTRMWFYQSIAPDGWTFWSGTGDRLLGVSDPTGTPKLYNGNIQPGTRTDLSFWQQADHVLTIDQIPSHSHAIRAVRSGQSSTSRVGRGTSGLEDAITYAANGNTIEFTGGSEAHNHGDTWRPAAAVGIICYKTS